MAGLPHRPPLALGALTHELAVLVHLRRAEVGRLDNRRLEIACNELTLELGFCWIDLKMEEL